MTGGISPMIVCTRCLGRMVVGLVEGVEEPCPRCEEHPGLDPSSFAGCCGDDCEEHGAVITIGIG